MAQAKGWILKAGWALLAVAVLSGCKMTKETFDILPGQSSQPSQGYSLPAGAPIPRSPAQTMPTAYDLPPSRIVKVGFLTPLSGRSQTLGKALQDAGVMALFDKYATLSGPQAGVRVELVPADTGDAPAEARDAAATVMKSNAEMIIGPLYSQSVEAIKPLAKTGKISIVSFSNNPEVAGDGVFTLGFNPEEQTHRVMRFAFTRGIQKVAVLAPNDAYGRQVVAAAEAEAKLFGRPLGPVVRYAPGAGALSEDIQKLAANGSQGARISFDALFLPEGGAQLGPILSELAKVNVTSKNVQFIGTGVWDDRDLIRQHDLEGAWLASGPPELYEAFEQRFINSYGYKPPRIASLAYDAVALAITLATSQGNLGRNAITDPSGFSGPANGIFRLLGNGRIERGLAVIQIHNGKFTVLDPAPVQF